MRLIIAYLGIGTIATVIVLGAVLSAQVPDPSRPGGAAVSFPEDELPFPVVPSRSPEISVRFLEGSDKVHGGITDAVRGERSQLTIVTIEVRAEELDSPTTYQIGNVEIFKDAQDRVALIPGVTLQFAPQEFVLLPGGTKIIQLIVNVLPTAPDGAYFVQYSLTTDAYSWRHSPSFELLIGNADPISPEQPIVEEA